MTPPQATSRHDCIRRIVQKWIIRKFTWGAEKDPLELYKPDTLLFIDKPFSTLEFNADQSQLDQLSFSQTSWLDEIRFGPSYQSVITGSVPLK